ncbi:DnaJ homolog subfamily A member 1/2-like protein [Aduncisulcus paluster]|uniref:DnaJ homolog subfamily A member 1/2-like protein n=1 Tax=Aduncisulcus paluster TaxID=2918883 RepID=A0ABQ5KWC8_9EUKA|nr:DnaJ homolog subfamily A member 1/2-like protein [Aduncisulcus paluster]
MKSFKSSKFVILLTIIIILSIVIPFVKAHDDSFYRILNVNKSSTAKEIKKSYYKLSQKYHPDRNPSPDAADHYSKITRAYDVLSDEKKRNIYDQYGMEALEQYETTGREPGNFGGLFDLFNMQNQEQQRPKVPDSVMPLMVTLEDVYSGALLTVTVRLRGLCPHCHGTKADRPQDVSVCHKCNGIGVITITQQLGMMQVRQQQTCPVCGGKGKTIRSTCHVCHGHAVMLTDRVVNIDVPAGSKNGERLVYAGDGHEAPDADTGDLVLIIDVGDHKIFERKDDDLHIDMSISLKEALLGFNREIVHLDRHIVKIHHDGVAKPGETMIIKGEGMPVKQNVGFYGERQYGDFTLKYLFDTTLFKKWLKKDNRLQLLLSEDSVRYLPLLLHVHQVCLFRHNPSLELPYPKPQKIRALIESKTKHGTYEK